MRDSIVFAVIAAFMVAFAAGLVLWLGSVADRCADLASPCFEA
jgi:hypothetical protein